MFASTSTGNRQSTARQFLSFHGFSYRGFKFDSIFPVGSNISHLQNTPTTFGLLRFQFYRAILTIILFMIESYLNLPPAVRYVINVAALWIFSQVIRYRRRRRTGHRDGDVDDDWCGYRGMGSKGSIARVKAEAAQHSEQKASIAGAASNKMVSAEASTSDVGLLSSFIPNLRVLLVPGRWLSNAMHRPAASLRQSLHSLNTRKSFSAQPSPLPMSPLSHLRPGYARQQPSSAFAALASTGTPPSRYHSLFGRIPFGGVFTQFPSLISVLQYLPFVQTPNQSIEESIASLSNISKFPSHIATSVSIDPTYDIRPPQPPARLTLRSGDVLEPAPETITAYKADLKAFERRKNQILSSKLDSTIEDLSTLIVATALIRNVQYLTIFESTGILAKNSSKLQAIVHSKTAALASNLWSPVALSLWSQPDSTKRTDSFPSSLPAVHFDSDPSVSGPVQSSLPDQRTEQDLSARASALSPEKMLSFSPALSGRSPPVAPARDSILPSSSSSTSSSSANSLMISFSPPERSLPAAITRPSKSSRQLQVVIVDGSQTSMKSAISSVAQMTIFGQLEDGLAFPSATMSAQDPQVSRMISRAIRKQLIGTVSRPRLFMFFPGISSSLGFPTYCLDKTLVPLDRPSVPNPTITDELINALRIYDVCQ